MKERQRVLVTGASSGIGRSTALRLAEAGWEVWGTSRDGERLPQADRFHPACLDLAETGRLAEVLDRLWSESGGFDVVVNNAGSGIFGPLEKVSEDEERALFEVLYHGPMVLTRAALARMKAAGGGRMVQVTTVGVELPIPYMGTYTAAKAALSAATRILRMELGRGSIRLIEVRPGDIQTGFNRSVARSEGSGTIEGKEVWERMERLMASAPDADVVGRKLTEVLGMEDPPDLVRVGSFFQTVVGPLGPRLLPERWVERAIADYYGLGTRAGDGTG
ncbi:MAG: SDR family NAD(P)-dependent oxidoreductase [Verrucomicrobiia bacterium]